jgi:hypothetical protein
MGLYRTQIASYGHLKILKPMSQHHCILIKLRCGADSHPNSFCALSSCSREKLSIATDILKNHMLPQLPRRHQNLVFMQDGASPHTALRVRDFLRANFGERVISRHFPWNWPARSPDLNPCDYFLWGYLKARVFMRNPHSLANLKQAIEEEINNLHPDLLALTVSSLFDRLLCILTADGGHIE